MKVEVKQKNGKFTITVDEKTIELYEYEAKQLEFQLSTSIEDYLRSKDEN